MCPDCQNCKYNFDRYGIEYKFLDVHTNLQYLKEFLKYIFDNKNVNSITLSVFDSNKVAKNLYEKQGFIIEKTIEKPKLKYIMRRFR